MKDKAYLLKVQIGRMIKVIADINGVSPSTIVNALFPVRYQMNPNKFFLLDDIDAKDLVRISFVLNYNFLEQLSMMCIPHLPVSGDSFESAKYSITLDPIKKSYSIAGKAGNCDFLNDINVGLSIRSFAESNGQNQKDIAELLKCSQSSVSDLYTKESLKVKELFWISEKLNHYFVYDLFLSRMRIVPSYTPFYQFTITFDEFEVRIKNPNDDSFLMVYLRQRQANGQNPIQ